jgi:hypothetical protein
MMNQDIESLDAEYAAMVADAEREAEARDWSDALVCNLDVDEPPDPLYSATAYAMFPVTV